MFNLHDPLPSKERAIALRNQFNDSLFKSLKHLLETCQSIIPSSLFLKAAQNLENLDPKKKQTGFLSLIHRNLLLAVKEESVEKALKALNSLTRIEQVPESIKYMRFEDIHEDFSEDVFRICTSEFNREVLIDKTKEEEFSRSKSHFKKTFSILEKTSSDFLDEAKNLISEIVIFSGTGIQAGSSFDLFGMIHINRNYKLDKFTDTIDFLIHEQSHLYLYMLMAQDPLVLNPLSSEYLSPLRKEKRTMQGVYHAVYVLTKIIYVLGLGLEKNSIPKEEKAYCQALMSTYKVKMDKSYEEIQKHGKLTSLGKKVIDYAVLVA